MAAEPRKSALRKRTIFAVVYGNYDHPEVNSLWADELDATEKCEALNRDSDTGMWEVQRMTLNERDAS
jgi:hypothetical protein